MQTPNLSLPLLASNQAQKHVTMNESLLRLDMLAQITVTSRSIVEPPQTLADGERFILAAQATGAWAGHDGELASWVDGAWIFDTPAPGWQTWVADESLFVVYDGDGWENVAPDRVERLGIGQDADTLNRLSVSSHASLFSHDGSDHRMKLNRFTGTDTATILFQTDFSGSAEIGLAGEPDFSIKVSADGTTWRTALRINPASGVVELPETPQSTTQQFSTPRQFFSVDSAAVFTTNSQTPAFIPGFSIGFTPSKTPCTVRIGGHATLGADFWGTAPQLSLWRSGVKVWPANGYAEHQLLANSASNSRYISYAQPIGFIDTLVSLDPVTYELRLSSRTSGINVHINRRHLDLTPRGDSLLTIEEIS